MLGCAGLTTRRDIWLNVVSPILVRLFFCLFFRRRRRQRAGPPRVAAGQLAVYAVGDD